MTVPAITKSDAFRCAICGVALRGDRWIFSPSTGQRYCMPDKWEACEERSLALRELAARAK